MLLVRYIFLYLRYLLQTIKQHNIIFAKKIVGILAILHKVLQNVYVCSTNIKVITSCNT